MLDMYINAKNAFRAVEATARTLVEEASNIQTPGYKSQTLIFEAFNPKEISPGTFVDEGFMTNPITLPGSVKVAGVVTNFAQGNIVDAPSPLHLAIKGTGFFIIDESRLSRDSSKKALTRTGRFNIDSLNKYIVDSLGRKLYGYKLNSKGEIVSDELVPIETNGELDVGFLDEGVLVANYNARKQAIEDGDPNPPSYIPLYGVPLTDVPNKQGLGKGVEGAYRVTAASGTFFEPRTSSAGFGSIYASSAEASNISLPDIITGGARLTQFTSGITGLFDATNKTITALISKLTA